MEWRKQLVFVLTSIQVVYQCCSVSIDDIISSAARTANDLAFFQGNDTTPMIRVELDMIFTPEQWAEMQSGQQTPGRRYRRKAVRNGSFRWPNGVIPYEISSVFTDRQKQEILAALSEWETNTCVRFTVASRNDKNKIRFDNGSGGCYSNVGMVGGTQEVGLGENCRVKRVVVHEVGHAVGFQHEQARPDRDSHVRINRQNIPPNLYYNFEKYPHRVVNNYDVPYDYKSVMHYGAKFFSLNGLPTIETLDPKYQDDIGNAPGMSFRDIKIANLMYNCSGHCQKRTCPGEGYMDKNCRCVCAGSAGNPLRDCTDTSSGSVTDRPTAKPVGETGSSETCRDTSQGCSRWTLSGDCQKYPLTMAIMCRKSCKKCSAGGQRGAGAPTLGDKCTDMGEHCEHLKSRGYCSPEYASYMRLNCAKTCNTCSSRTQGGLSAPKMSTTTEREVYPVAVEMAADSGNGAACLKMAAALWWLAGPLTATVLQMLTSRP